MNTLCSLFSLDLLICCGVQSLQRLVFFAEGSVLKVDQQVSKFVAHLVRQVVRELNIIVDVEHVFARQEPYVQHIASEENHLVSFVVEEPAVLLVAPLGNHLILCYVC